MTTLYIERWVYERGNYQIILENGANFDFYSQERLTVNGERVRLIGWQASSFALTQNWVKQTVRVYMHRLPLSRQSYVC